ncbi:Unknown protein, partial [Striga hermonthica]
FETIFQNGDLILMKDTIKSLRPDFNVAVLDTWCRILNLRELNRKPDMPLRFFGSSYSSMNSVPIPNEKWHVESKARLFCESMANDLRTSGFDDKLEDIDMEDAIIILDNSSVGGTSLGKYHSQHVHL